MFASLIETTRARDLEIAWTSAISWKMRSILIEANYYNARTFWSLRLVAVMLSKSWSTKTLWRISKSKRDAYGLWHARALKLCFLRVSNNDSGRYLYRRRRHSTCARFFCILAVKCWPFLLLASSHPPKDAYLIVSCSRCSLHASLFFVVDAAASATHPSKSTCAVSPSFLTIFISQ